MYASLIETYKSVQKTGMSGREIEASVLTKAALMLKNCKDNWDASGREAKLEEALKLNQMIWSIFEGEMVKEDNPLPKALRMDILALGTFIDKRIFDIMAFPSSEKLDAIIDINLNLAAGLMVSSK